MLPLRSLGHNGSEAEGVRRTLSFGSCLIKRRAAGSARVRLHLLVDGPSSMPGEPVAGFVACRPGFVANCSAPYGATSRRRESVGFRRDGCGGADLRPACSAGPARPPEVKVISRGGGHHEAVVGRRGGATDLVAVAPVLAADPLGVAAES